MSIDSKAMLADLQTPMRCFRSCSLFCRCQNLHVHSICSHTLLDCDFLFLSNGLRDDDGEDAVCQAGLDRLLIDSPRKAEAALKLAHGSFADPVSVIGAGIIHSRSRWSRSSFGRRGRFCLWGFRTLSGCACIYIVVLNCCFLVGRRRLLGGGVGSNSLGHCWLLDGLALV